MTATTRTLPPPTSGHRSRTRVSIESRYAVATAMRLGDGLQATNDNDGFVTLRATDTTADVSREIWLSIHRDGISALIAELQRVTA
jgi:hypothetical protein